jgi:ABC-type transport system substrate-binding protein
LRSTEAPTQEGIPLNPGWIPLRPDLVLYYQKLDTKEQLVLEKNPNYWGEASNIDTIILKEMTSVDAQITALQNGEIDIALGLNTDTAKQLEGTENITIANGPTALITFW